LRHSEKPFLHSHDNIAMIFEPIRPLGINSRRCVLSLVLILYLDRLGEEQEGFGVDWDLENGVMNFVFRLLMFAYRQERGMGE